MDGGSGAEAIGEMTITGKERTFYAYVGGQGESANIIGGNKGGWNGGGQSGSDTDDGVDWPGGGGGASDIRIDGNQIDDRIIVAAVGSGASYYYPGADGGDLKGRFINKNFNNAKSPDTNQSNGYEKGLGGDGKNGKYSGSGGGGGYWGGKGGDGEKNMGDDGNKTVGNSGSSYISGFNGCEKHTRMTFENGRMIVGNLNEGHGKIIIEFLYVCSENCYICSKNDTCDVCTEKAILDQETKKCINCSSPCNTCSLNTTHCESCISGYFLCNNNCYASCTDLNDQDNGKYYGKDTNDECKICADPNCIDCSSDYSKCNECSNEYKYDIETNKCILRSTSVFTKSHVFTLSKFFSESKGFTKSSDFSSSVDFTKSPAFTKFVDFSGPVKFSNSIIISDSAKLAESGKLRKSFAFSESEDFSRSTVFSGSVKFSNSKIFSESIIFTRSTEFAESSKFAISRDYSKFSFSYSEKPTESDKFSSNLIKTYDVFSSPDYFYFSSFSSLQRSSKLDVSPKMQKKKGNISRKLLSLVLLLDVYLLF